MLQYWVQFDDDQAPLHQTCPALEAYWYCVPGLLAGQLLLVPSQLLKVLLATHAPLIEAQTVLPEQRVVDKFLESPGHAAPAHDSGMSHTPALALHTPLGAYPHAPAPLQKSPAQLFIGFNVHSEYVSAPPPMFWHALFDPSQ